MIWGWMGQRLPSAALRAVGLVLQTIVAAWMLMLYSYSSGTFMPIFNETFLSFLGALAALAVTLALYTSWGDRFEESAPVRSVLTLGIGVLLLWGLTAELSRSLGSGDIKNFSVSALWCVYATLLVGLGIARRYAPIRLLGMVVFGLVVLKVFLFDFASLERIWRVLSFVCLGLILIGVSYLYHLYGEHIRAFVREDTGRGRRGGV